MDSNTLLFETVRPKYVIVKSSRIKLSLFTYEYYPSNYCLEGTNNMYPTSIFDLIVSEIF